MLMGKDTKISHRFRAVLKHEIAVWRNEGIIEPRQADVLSDRYDLAHIGSESRNLMLTTLYIIGALLVGGGVISFVAAHWDAMDKITKISLIVSFMLGCYGVGYYLWQVNGKYVKLGHTLILLGVLMFGANIGLIAQIFHIKSNFYNGFGAWAVGATLLAWAIGSVPVITVAVVTSFIWFCGWIEDNHNHNNAALNLYPLVPVLVFATFAYLQRSTFTIILSALALGLSLVISAAVYHDILCMNDFAIIFGAVAAGLLIYFWGAIQNKDGWRSFGMAGIITGTAFFAFAIYIASYFQIIKHSYRSSSQYHIACKEIADIAIIAAALVAGVILAIIYFVKALKNSMAIGLSVIVAAGMILPAFLMMEMELAMVLTANLLCVALSANLIATSIKHEDRRIFWAGSLFLVLVIISRFLEMETDLMFKAFGFIISGLGLIGGSVLFERHLKARRTIHD